MSGPVTTDDVPDHAARSRPDPCTIEITESHSATVGSATVRRALPRRQRRTVGAWCFVDHMGPVDVAPGRGIDVGPHPHIGLQTVTWLLRGEILHRDSLGSEQVIRPGQLNLMTAGHGVAHSEEGTGYQGALEGVQLWVAQPAGTRHQPPAFEHHAELPGIEVGPSATGTVLVGSYAGATSPARHDTEHVGLDLHLAPGGTTLPLRAEFEYALVLFEGRLSVAGREVEPGHLAYLGIGHHEVDLSVAEATRALVIGGVPIPDPIVMWWNYVAGDRHEISAAHQAWEQGADRFGVVASRLARAEAGPPPWDRTAG